MTKDAACGLVAIVVAAIYLFAASGLRSSPLGDSVGSAGFPKIIGWGLALAGLLLILQTLWGRFRGRAAAGAQGWIPSEAFAAGAGRAMLRAAGVVGIIIAYLVLLQPLGYILSVALMVGAVALYLGAPATWRVAATAAFGGVSLWLLFVVLLEIPLPAGITVGWL